MKTIFRAALLVGLVVFASAQTSAPQTSPASAPPPSPAHELAALESFLALSDAELAQLADALARVRAMTPAQRATLREQIAAYRQLPEPQRLQLRQGWGWMSPEIQNGWREMMQAASPEERATIQTKLQSLSPEEKTRYRRGLVEAYLKARAAKAEAK